MIIYLHKEEVAISTRSNLDYVLSLTGQNISLKGRIKWIEPVKQVEIR